MARVFIVGPGPRDYSPAAKYGELVHVLSHRCNPFATDVMQSDIRRELFEVHRITADDCLMFCGNPYLNVVAACLFSQHFGKLRFLVYGAKHHDYTLRDITLKNGGTNGYDQAQHQGRPVEG